MGPHRQLPLTIGLVALVAGLAATAGLPARATEGARTSGDEPQYLLTATSLARDHDLDIANQLGTASYLPYHEVPTDPQSAVLDGGRRLSPHDPLLPLLLAWPMALGGWVGAKVALAVLAAATAALTAWLAVTRFSVGPSTAGVVVAGAFAGMPLAPYGTQVYPEMPAALALTVAVAAIARIERPVAAVPTERPTEPGPVTSAALVALVAIVALPWLSVKYVPVATGAGLALLWRLGRRPPQVVAVVLTAAVAGALYLAAHRHIYGGWTVYAAGDHFVTDGELSVVGTGFDPLGRSRRLGGLLVDRVFGLAAWSPLWALLPVAAGRAIGRTRGPGQDRGPDPGHEPTTLAAALVAITWLTATYVALTMHGWWVPGRQLVVALPLAAILVAFWVDGSAVRRRVALALGLVGAVNWSWLAVEASTGRRTLIVDFAATAAPPYRVLSPFLPDGMRASPLDTALLVGWTVAAVAALVHGFATADGRRPRRSATGPGTTEARPGPDRVGDQT